MSVTNNSNCRMSVVTRRLYSGLLCLRSPLVVCIPRILSSQGACRLFTCISECFRLVLILCGCISVTLIRYLVVKALYIHNKCSSFCPSVNSLLCKSPNYCFERRQYNTHPYWWIGFDWTQKNNAVAREFLKIKSNQIKSNQKKCKHLTCDQKLTGNQFSLLHVQK